MIHYHGLPITPEKIMPESMQGAHFFVSFEYTEQLAIATMIGSSFAADNGAFSRWRSGDKSEDWSKYYKWIEKIKSLPTFDFAIIPDSIEGGEDKNNQLIHEWKFGRSMGAPVWHLHESLERLEVLAAQFERVCLGSSGEFAVIGTPQWWKRMHAAMEVICNIDGTPKTKIHGLRMLDVDIVSKFPFKSADSTNIARNTGLDSRWNGSYTPPTKAARASILRQRIESVHSPSFWKKPEAEEGFLEMEA